MRGSSEILSEIAAAIARHTPTDGERATAIENLFVSRKSSPSRPSFTVQWPCFALVAQGEKTVSLGADTHRYGVGDYLVVSADLPVDSQVTVATRARPNLGIGLALDPARIGAVLARTGLRPRPRDPTDVGSLAVGHAPLALLDAVSRLVGLLDHPQHAPALASLYEEEIVYFILSAPSGGRLLHLVTGDAAEARAHRAARVLRERYTEALRIEELARHAAMSVSSLHEHFKALTGLSPLQYQKRLRLQEARRALLAEGVDVTTASIAVGYTSLSQFSREYTRLFGVSPRSDRKGSA